MVSIRRTLLVFLMASLFVVSLVIVVLSYLSAVHEMDELYDKNMEQMAETLVSQLEATSVNSDKTDDKINGEEEFLIQVWSGDHQLLYSSHPAIPFPELEENEFSLRFFEGEEWRVYVAETARGQVQLSQPVREREYLIDEVTVQILLPLLLQIPLIGLLVWLAVGRGLRPLTRISTALSRRSATSLAPLDLGKTPEEVQPLVRELNALFDRLQGTLETQRRFTADAAHELRTPLAALQLQLDLLKRATEKSEREQAESRLQEGIHRATHLVQQLLALARLGPETARTSLVRLDMASLTHSCIEQFLPQALSRNIDLGCSRIESSFMMGEPEKLRLLLGNLIDNALRYTAAGGRVDVSVYSQDQECVLKVSDNGIGIPEAERERVFERFYRVAGTKTSGTGLGLAMVLSVVEHYRGSIFISDGLGGSGVCFKICFPEE